MLSPEYVLAVEESVAQTSRFPVDFESETVTEYMRDRRRAMRLIDICLGPVVSARIEHSPLEDLLRIDETNPAVQAESPAYIYAFRRLIGMLPDTPKWSKTALIQLIQTVPFRLGFLVKVLLSDVSSIVRTFPRERTPEAYEMIANSNYVAILSELYTADDGEITKFIDYQLLFPLSPASVIAHYYACIGQEEDSIPIGFIGNTSLYSREILWLSEQLLEHGSYIGSGYNDVLMLELGGLLNIFQRFSPEDVKPAQNQLIALAMLKGLSQEDVDKVFEGVSDSEFTDVEDVRAMLSFLPPNLGTLVEDVRAMLSFLPPNLGTLTRAEARALLDRIILLRPTNTQKHMIVRMGKMIDNCYLLGGIKEEEEDF